MSAGKSAQAPRTASGDEFVVVEGIDASNSAPTKSSQTAVPRVLSDCNFPTEEEIAAADAKKAQQAKEATPVTVKQLQDILDIITPKAPANEGPLDFLKRQARNVFSNDFVKEQFVEFLTTKKIAIERGEAHSQKVFGAAFNRFIVGLKATRFECTDVSVDNTNIAPSGERGLNHTESLQVERLEGLVRSQLSLVTPSAQR